MHLGYVAQSSEGRRHNFHHLGFFNERGYFNARAFRSLASIRKTAIEGRIQLASSLSAAQPLSHLAATACSCESPGGRRVGPA